MSTHESGSNGVNLSLLILALAATTPAMLSANQDGITTREGPWLIEDEFDADATLHARDGQTVLLHLEQGSKRGGASSGAPGTNTVRLLVEEEATYNFCIPDDEPYLERLKLREGRVDQQGKGNGRGRGRTVLQVRPGQDCGSVRLAPGSYVLEARHDHRNVPPAKVAFLRLPEPRQMAGDPLTAPTATLSLLAFKDLAGRYVKASNTNSGNLLANGSSVNEYAVFKLSGTTSQFQLADGAGNPVNVYAIPNPVRGDPCATELYTGSRFVQQTNCAQQQLRFNFTSKSNNKTFGLVGQNVYFRSNGNWDSPIYVESSPPTINFRTSFVSGDTFYTDFRGFTCSTGVCDASALSLQQGEVALFSEENYGGTAFVYTAQVPNLGIYDAAAANGLAIGDGTAKSLRVGPDTLAFLYTEVGFAGTELIAGGDVPNLADTPVGAISLSSFKSEEARNYILASGGCANCDLNGIDLSGLDLAAADFTNTDLDGANLAGTSLFGATLDDATIVTAALDGTDLRDTSLRCTDLSKNDLTTAFLNVTTDSVAAITDDGSEAIIGVDLVSGDRTLISGQGVGAGVAFGNPSGIATSTEGLVVGDAMSIIRVKGSDRTVISSNSVGTGPRFLSTTAVAIDGAGQILVTDFARQAVVTVDPRTGNRAIVSGSTVGTGTAFDTLFGLAVGDDGTVYVTDSGLMGILAVDPATGDRSVVSSSSVGSGPAFQVPGDVIVDDDGSLLVTDNTIPALLRVDPATGNRTVISGAGTGAGPALQAPGGIVEDVDGTLLVVDLSLPGLVRIDPMTGDRATVSAGGIGNGVAFSAPLAVTLVDSASLNGRIATDFSCRLVLAESTFDVDAIAPALWRYTDISGATISGLENTPLSTAEAPVNFSGIVMNAANLSNARMDGGIFECVTATNDAATPCEVGATAGTVCSCLQSTNLTQASLGATSFDSAQMQGASLTRANLDGATMTSAALDALSKGANAADLSSAFLRDVDLSDARMSGVTANNANFYSGFGEARATGATMNNIRFKNAYLAGVDFSSVTAQNSDWGNAVLVGANFNKANLTTSADVGAKTDFTGAYLQGARFDSAEVSGADFTDTYWDFRTQDDLIYLVIQLQTANKLFTGYWNDASSAACVAYQYPGDQGASVIPPTTGADSRCPDGLPPTEPASSPACTFMEIPETPIEQAEPPSALCNQPYQGENDPLDCDFPTSPENMCTEADFTWVL